MPCVLFDATKGLQSSVHILPAAVAVSCVHLFSRSTRGYMAQCKWERKDCGVTLMNRKNGEASSEFVRCIGPSES